MANDLFVYVLCMVAFTFVWHEDINMVLFAFRFRGFNGFPPALNSRSPPIGQLADLTRRVLLTPTSASEAPESRRQFPFSFFLHTLELTFVPNSSDKDPIFRKRATLQLKHGKRGGLLCLSREDRERHHLIPCSRKWAY